MLQRASRVASHEMLAVLCAAAGPPPGCCAAHASARPAHAQKQSAPDQSPARTQVQGTNPARAHTPRCS